MLFNLLALESPIGFGLNLLRYLTFRTGGAILTSLIVSFLIGGPLIKYLKRKQGKGQPIRSDGPESHLITKVGTPTMGGILILISLIISVLLWADLESGYVWTVLLVTIGFGLVGFADDYLKITRRSSNGLNGKVKLLIEILVASVAIGAIIYLTKMPLSTSLSIPFFKSVLLDFGWFFVPFAVFVVVGAGNAVNLTDGLDGLAIVPVMIAAACFAFISYIVGNIYFASYLQLNYIAGVGEVAVFCGALVGSSIGFLWFNAPPAKVFMGDTGSLALGGALGIISVITKHEIVLVIIGGLFVLETISVIIQVLSFKLTGKRMFRMAPLHHHYEKKGWAESTIVIRFWIIAIILALIGLSTLKLR